jgi:hypothetical protein
MVHVLLGDGSVNKQAIPSGSGEVKFPGVTLPQDVTIVTGDAQYTGVVTIAGFDKNDLWMNNSEPEVTCPCADRSVQGNIVGTIIQTSGVVWVGSDRGFPGTASGSTWYANIHQPESLPTTFDFVAFDGNQGRAVNAGVLKGVSLPKDANVQNQNITLDHPFDQDFVINVTNDAATGGAYRGRLFFYARDTFLFGTDADDPFPVTVKTPVMDAALDLIDRRAEVISGQNDENDWQQIDPTKFFGSSFVPVAPNATSTTVNVANPAKVTTPVVGTWDAPGTASRTALAVSWTAAPEAALVEIEVRPASQGPTGYVSWTVYAPASQGAFAFFPLPADVTPNSAFQAGANRLRLVETSSPTLKSASDYWSVPGGPRKLAMPIRSSTTQWGMLTLQ